MPGVLAFLFILGYIMAVSGFALLLRYSEGATLLAIVLVSVLHCPLILSLNFICSVILLHEKFLQFDWLRAVVFQLNLKYLHVKITNLLRVVV